MKFFSQHSVFRHSEIDDAVLTLTQKDAARLETPLSHSGLFFLRLGIAAMLAILGGRVFFLSVLEGEKYRERAAENNTRNILVPAPRGLIFDRYGTPLVRNVPSMELIALPEKLPRDRLVREELFRSLHGIFDLGAEAPEAEFLALDESSAPLVLKSVLTQEEMLIFSSRAESFPGVTIEKSAIREYSDSVIFSHVIGYEGKIKKEELESNPLYLPIDAIGKQGVEKEYESVLRGTRGADRKEVDSRGMTTRELAALDPIPGSDLFLNIDAELQKKSFDTLRAFLESKNLTKGAVVALDPRDGSVLALVSFPSFDNNLFARGIDRESYRALLEDPAHPLFHRAIAGTYPPGSTIKPFVATAALSEGIVTPSTQIESRGGISVGSFSFGDWKAHGFTDIRQAIAVSSDVYFYSVGGGYGSIRGLGLDKLNEYERLFGFGEKTGIDLPGEEDGFLPTESWKKERMGERWYIGDTYHASIGQGFVLATPLQIAVGTAAVANGGTVWKPRVTGQVRAPDGSTKTLPPEARHTLSSQAAALGVVREGMRLTVTEGTARSLRDLPISVAGKTGTAQFGNEEKTHGWFSSFAPYEDPSITLTVLVEDQNDKETYNAVPVTHDILRWYFSEGRGKTLSKTDSSS